MTQPRVYLIISSYALFMEGLYQSAVIVRRYPMRKVLPRTSEYTRRPLPNMSHVGAPALSPALLPPYLPPSRTRSHYLLY